MFFNPSFDGSDTTLELGFFICANAMFLKLDLYLALSEIALFKFSGVLRRL